MQPRLAATITRLNQSLLSFASQNKRVPLENRSLAFAYSSSVGRTADPAVHAGDTEGEDAEQAARTATARHRSENKPGKENDAYVPPKSPPASSPRLKSRVVSEPLEPHVQQKRSLSAMVPVEEINCAGLDVGPDTEERKETGTPKVESEREYFGHHKASPLSEIEIADTRKPISRATDATVDSYSGEYGLGGIIVYRPEQMDTAEDSLRRAMDIWRQNAARGDPDSPHGRFLRAAIGECS